MGHHLQWLLSSSMVLQIMKKKEKEEYSYYCTIPTNHSHPVKRDAQSSLEVMFTTQCDV